MAEAQHRDKIERDLVREYAQTGRAGELNTPEFQRALAQRHVAAGVARPADREKAREGSYNNLRKMTYDLDAFMRDDLASDPKTQGLLGTEAHDEMRTTAFQAAGLPLPPDLKRKNIAAQKAQDKEASVRPSDQFARDRAETIKAVDDEYAADPDKRKIYNGMDHKKARLDALKAKGLATERDAETRPGLRGVGIGVFGMVGGINQGVRGGEGVGNAVGQIAQGLERGVTSAASGFIRAGEVALGLFLSPFGKAGAGMAKIAGGLGGGMVAALRAGGAVAGGVTRAGAGLIGGAMGLGAGVAGAGVGAAIGSVVPGIGTLAGAGLGASVAGGVVGAVGSALSSIGGQVGQMLGGVGDAVGQLGKSIGDALGSVKDVLSDLIDEGKKFAGASFAVQRGTGGSLGAAAGVSSLSQLLTGSPGSFSGIFSGFGMEGPYMGERARAFNIPVPQKTDFLSVVQAGQGTWNKMGGGFEGSIRRGEMMNAVFGGNQDIGNLFSLGMGTKAVQVARATAPSAKELRQDALIGFQLNEVGRQLDSIKLKFLTDLMPAIKMGVGAVGSFLGQNGKGIGEAMKQAGEWLFVKGPSMFKGFVEGLFALGQALTTVVPGVVQFGVTLYKTFATVFDGMLPLMKTWGSLILAPLVAIGKVKPSVLRGVLGMKGIDPNALDGLPKKAAQWGVTAQRQMQKGQTGFDRFFGHAFGSEAGRQRQWDKAMGGHGGLHVETTVNLKVEDNKDAMSRLKADVARHTAMQFIRGQARAGA